MINISLYKKLAISLSFVFMLIIGSFIYITQSFESISRDRAEQELHRELASHLVNDNPLLADGEHDHVALENLFHSMMILGPNFEFYVLDQEGKILTYSAKPGEVVRKKVNMSPIKSVLSNSMSFPVYADDPRSQQQKIFSVAPILKSGEIRGYLFVIVGGQIYDSILNSIRDNERLQVLGTLAILSMLFLLLILLASFHFFVRPLKQLTSEVGALSEGNFQNKLPLIKNIKTGLEVSELSSAFNHLIKQVNSQLEQLSIVDNERRELLAHLSHDLRTPLSSLQGFLQTIQLKQNSISSETNRIYIDRCMKSAVSLKGFVDQIFELAHLESGQVTISTESFPIAELLFDVIDKFSVIAKGKEITMKVELASENAIVTTDIAKVERILTNLVENALRHTPKGGEICLGTKYNENHQQVILIVKDSGTGIDEKELPYLFDPRYRGKQAVEDGKRHIGLGLTITKKLAGLLNSEVKANNNPEGGANFRFSLSVNN